MVIVLQHLLLVAKSVSVLRRTGVLLLVRMVKVMTRGPIRCVCVYIYVCLCVIFIMFVRVRRVLVARRRAIPPVIVLAVKWPRYVEC